MRYDLVIKTANQLRKQGKYLQAELLVNQHLKLGSMSFDDLFADCKRIWNDKEGRASVESLEEFKFAINKIFDMTEDKVKFMKKLHLEFETLTKRLNKIIDATLDLAGLSENKEIAKDLINEIIFAGPHFINVFKTFINLIRDRIIKDHAMTESLQEPTPSVLKEPTVEKPAVVFEDLSDIEFDF